MNHIDIEGCLIAKMNQNSIRNFLDAELQRVFANVVGPTCCIRATKQLVNEGLIHIENGRATMSFPQEEQR